MTFDEHSDFRRTVAAYNEQLMRLYRRGNPSPAQPGPETAPTVAETVPEEPAVPEEVIVIPPPAVAPDAGGTDDTGGISDGTAPAPQALYPATSAGYLKFFTTTARMAEPVPRAHIVVTKDGNIVATAFTDISGLSPLLTLPAVDSSYSLSPDNPQPYTLYSATVSADGFYTQRIENMELYGGTTALQPVALIPLPVGTVSGTETAGDRPPKV